MLTINLGLVDNNRMMFRPRSKDIRDYIVRNVGLYPQGIAQKVSEQFGISRQAVNRHFRILINLGLLEMTGKTKSRRYGLRKILELHFRYSLSDNPEEHIIWERDLGPAVGKLPKNVMQILEFGFTEMFNNAIDHSEGDEVAVELQQTAARTAIVLHDDGIGIFKKIQDALRLSDVRHAVLELAKGKFTTDPTRHSGEGVFFTSRMFEPFLIVSNDVAFTHERPSTEDWVWRHSIEHRGTTVFMEIANDSSTDFADVFGQYSTGEEKDFTKTIVPVKMAQYGSDRLISRSQAKRIVAGLERFKHVVLDFKGIEIIGQGFADEIFRVFHTVQPQIELMTINVTPEVQNMIDHVRHGIRDK